MASVPVWRGRDGRLAPEDRTRVDAAIDVSENLGAVIGEVEAARDVAEEAAWTSAIQADIATDAVVITLAQAEGAQISAAEAAAAARQSEIDRQASQAARAGAEAALIAAALGAGIFPTIALGRASVENGNGFWVAANATDGLTRSTIFRRDTATTQTVVVEIASMAEFAAKAEKAEVDVLTAAVKSLPSSGAVIVSIQDEAGNGTFMTARTLDGGPTHDAARLIGGSMREVGELAFEDRDDVPFLDDYLFAVMDRTGRALSPDLLLRKSDGRLAESAIASIGARLPIPRPRPDGTWPHPSGGRFARYDADLRTIVSWGSSSPEISTAAWAELATELGATFIPKAKGGTTNEHVLIQMGAFKPSVVGGTLAGEIDSVLAVTVETMTSGRISSFRPTTGLLVNGATQVPVRLEYSVSTLRVVRLSAGAAVMLTSGWQFWSDDERLRSKMALVWSAKNDVTEGQSAQGVADEVLTITNYLSPISPRYLVIGLFPNPWYTTEQVARVAATDAIMAQTYGELFVPVMPSLLDPQIFSALGITETAEDATSRAAGYVPPSLMGDLYHLTLPVYAWIAQNLIKPKLTTEFGWYQEA